MAKLIDVDELEEFQPVLTSQMRPLESQGKQWLPLRHVLGLLRAEVSGGNARAVGLIQRLQTPADVGRPGYSAMGQHRRLQPLRHWPPNPY